MIVKHLIKPWTEYSLNELKDIPIIIRLTIEPEYVAAGNSYATELGIRKGMLLDSVNYFCWKPLIITVRDIEEIPVGIIK